MSGDVVLDSVILIDHFNSVSQATAYLQQVGEGAAITAITRAEVLTGFDTADVPLAVALLSRFRLLGPHRGNHVEMQRRVVVAKGLWMREQLDTSARRWC